MRRAISVVTLSLALMTTFASTAFADAPEAPGIWTENPTVLCIVGYHLIQNPAHPDWWMPFCTPDHP
jgi:hypothetical protein